MFRKMGEASCNVESLSLNRVFSTCRTKVSAYAAGSVNARTCITMLPSHMYHCLCRRGRVECSVGLLLPFELELECDLCCASASAIALCGLAASGDVGIIDDIGDSTAMGSVIATGMKEARRLGERAKEGIKGQQP